MNKREILTAHRQLGARPGTYTGRWEIINGDLEVVATVNDEAIARRIVAEQSLRPMEEPYG